jgi:hypothetical protein
MRAIIRGVRVSHLSDPAVRGLQDTIANQANKAIERTAAATRSSPTPSCAATMSE